jgi:Nif-specific regulatory protein
MMYSILNQAPEPITRLRSDAPMALERIVSKSLAKRTSERYQRMDDMLTDLQLFQREIRFEKSKQALTQPALIKNNRYYLLAGWISQHHKPLLTNNVVETLGPENLPAKYRDLASILSVPLELHGTSLGVINLVSLTAGQKFGERELRLLEILAAQAAQFIANARLHEKLFDENLRLRQEVQNKYSSHGIIGHSPKMQEMFALLERVIPTEGRVLLEGESGTGKELVARVIHYNGPRQEKPFVAVDCGALPANLLESELFGYIKGAFTGALRDKKGLFEAANGGTLFLDEIVNMPLEIQSKFLRAIQEGEIRPLGSTQVRKVDVRIIAAASRNLRTEVQAGRFRQDLFFRLNVVNIPLPRCTREKKIS